jgi:hypothetical protein
MRYEMHIVPLANREKDKLCVEGCGNSASYRYSYAIKQGKLISVHRKELCAWHAWRRAKETGVRIFRIH